MYVHCTYVLCMRYSCIHDIFTSTVHTVHMHIHTVQYVNSSLAGSTLDLHYKMILHI